VVAVCSGGTGLPASETRSPTAHHQRDREADRGRPDEGDGLEAEPLGEPRQRKVVDGHHQHHECARDGAGEGAVAIRALGEHPQQEEPQKPAREVSHEGQEPFPDFDFDPSAPDWHESEG